MLQTLKGKVSHREAPRGGDWSVSLRGRRGALSRGSSRGSTRFPGTLWQRRHVVSQCKRPKDSCFCCMKDGGASHSHRTHSFFPLWLHAH